VLRSAPSDPFERILSRGRISCQQQCKFARFG